MKFSKKVIVMSVMSALVLPVVAQAEVTVYGQARMSVDSNRNGDNTADKSGSAVAVSSNASRLGFKGTEDLGDGLKAVWQFEREVFFDNGKATSSNGDATFKARNTYLGLNGGFGTALLGTHDTPYKLATASHDIMADTRGDYNALVMHDTRADNVIAYLSPDFAGLKFAVAYVPSYKNDDVSRSSTYSYDSAGKVKTTAESKQKGTSANVTYAVGPVDMSLAYEKLSAADGTNNNTYDDKAIKLGVAVKIGDSTRVGLVVDKRDWTSVKATSATAFTTASKETSTKWLNLTQNVGKGSIRAGYGMVDETVSGANDGAKMLTAGYFHGMGKNLELYALGTKVANDDGGTYSVKGVSSSSVAGKTVISASLGMNLKF